MSKIANAFQNKKAFIGFLTAGDPSLDKTEEFILEMERAGADLIEIGIPFSDPIAEGAGASRMPIFGRFLWALPQTRFLQWWKG